MSNKTRKRIWPVSLAAAIGVVALLAVMAAAMWTPSTAQAQAPLAEPANLSATADSATAISLTWAAGLGQTAYELERKEGNDPGWDSVSDTITGLSYTDTGLGGIHHRTPTGSAAMRTPPKKAHVVDTMPWRNDTGGWHHRHASGHRHAR